MEELRSTDNLYRAIHDDARRRAEKILEAAESDCRKIELKAAEDFEKAAASKRAEYEQMLSGYRRDSEASVPLEKQRRLISFVDSSVREALDSWFAKADKKKKLSALRRLLEKYSEVLSGNSFELLTRGFSKKDVSVLASSVLGKDAALSIEEMGEAEAERLDVSEGFTVRSEDGAVFCRVTCDELKLELLQSWREQLAEKLFGKDLFSAAGAAQEKGL